ncbi:MAG: phosphoribosylanthranilate isomerase [Melioribacteraceae bacterium]|nr:phosphoribosylanthranilate isomerase [Melioribacteraceae bacterium]
MKIINNRIDFKNYIQIAGIIDTIEAEMLIQLGIKYLGFPLRLPVNKEDLTEKEAGDIIRKLKPPVQSVIISYSETADEAIELCRKTGASIIQLHGGIDLDEVKRIKDQSINVIKSLVITDNNEEELNGLIRELESEVDAFITDTYDPVSGASGATGKTHDWNVSKKFVELSSKPVILAGGLNPDNVYDAIIKVRPSGVDVHTGIEDIKGRKDKFLTKRFIDEARRAFAKI